MAARTLHSWALAPVVSACCAVAMSGFTQVVNRPPSVRVSPDRPVRLGAGDAPAIEPHLAIDPDNDQHWLAGVFLAERLGDPRVAPPQGTLTCVSLTSHDAGATWARHDFGVRNCVDPWVALLPNGRAVFLALSGSELLLFRSTDGGKTWEAQAHSFGHGFDHGTLGVDAVRQRLYVVAHRTNGDRGAAVFVTHSRDGGVTFERATETISTNLPTFPANPVILSTGSLVVPYSSYARFAVRSEPGPLDLSWSIRSEDAGSTLSIPAYIGDCAGHWSVTAIDESRGPYRDRIYWTCWDRANRTIYLFRSEDGGRSWAPPAVVATGSVQNAMVAVNRNGVVGVAWYDARNDPRGYRGTFRCQHIFFTASADGGRTFLPDVRVSSAENCPDTLGNGEAGRRWVAGGDYFGLATTSDGAFRLLWTDSRDGRYQLRTATVGTEGVTAK